MELNILSTLIGSLLYLDIFHAAKWFQIQVREITAIKAKQRWDREVDDQSR
jgi:hypothetical protein